MRLSAKALALTFGLLWGGAILCVGIVNMAAPDYGVDFLKTVSSVYPGFHASRGVLNLLVGTVYGIVDGGFGGLLTGWLYNRLAHSVETGQ